MGNAVVRNRVRRRMSEHVRQHVLPLDPPVDVVVRAQVRPFGRALRGLPAVRVSARAVAATEPGAP